jgi:glycosyltransferase involved in cell wall biosynthesis
MPPRATCSSEPFALVVPQPPSLTETFITDHAQRLSSNTLVIHGWRPVVGTRTVMSRPEIAYYWARRRLFGESPSREMTTAYARALRRHGARAVMAEYGPQGVAVVDACKRLGIPLVVHFHGFDASIKSVLEEYRESYRRLFREADAFIAVSRRMRRDLIAMGAPAERVYWNPCGVDTREFSPADPAAAGPTLVTVGRFTEKKGPTYTLRAFALARERVPGARLRMLGGGPLFEASQALVRELGIGDSVDLLGPRPHAEVAPLMQSARAFVQHSVIAPSGDSEGTPVAVLEAGATGLPVISTRHAGIPDVVVEGETGLLVDERDVEGMAEHMARLLADPALAGRMGRAARLHVEQHFSMAHSLERLWSVIAGCIAGRPLPAADALVAVAA